MKKATLETIRTALLDAGYESTDPVMVEIDAELNKGAELKAQNTALYELAKPIVMDELGDSTSTISELWEAVEEKVPTGFTKGKLQYAMTRLWIGDLERVEGKVNSYRKA